MYVNGSDGVHYLKIKEGKYQLIFGESKMYSNLGEAINNAITSISEFKNETNKNGEAKSGLTYEKQLISDNLDKEIENNNEKEFLTSIIYPQTNPNINVDDAFGIFIGYEIKITQEEKALENDKFRKLLQQRVNNEIEKVEDKINKKIIAKDLNGHNFYIYIVPFTEIKQNRKKILEEVIK